MAYAIPFDTLAFVKELESVGVPPPQAEAHAKVLVSALQKVEEFRLDELATKGDMLRLEIKIEGTGKEIEKSKAETIRWTAGMFAAQTTLILGAMFAMLKLNQPPSPPILPPASPAQEMRLPMPPPAPPGK